MNSSNLDYSCKQQKTQKKRLLTYRTVSAHFFLLIMISTCLKYTQIIPKSYITHRDLQNFQYFLFIYNLSVTS